MNTETIKQAVNNTDNFNPLTVPNSRLLLKVSEAARMVGLTKSRAYDLVSKGVIPSVRLSPSTLRIPVKALEAWIAANTQGGVS